VSNLGHRERDKMRRECRPSGKGLLTILLSPWDITVLQIQDTSSVFSVVVQPLLQMPIPSSLLLVDPLIDMPSLVEVMILVLMDSQVSLFAAIFLLYGCATSCSAVSLRHLPGSLQKKRYVNSFHTLAFDFKVTRGVR